MAAMSPPISCYLFFFHDRFEQLIFFNQSLFGGWHIKRYKQYLCAVRNDAHCLNVLLQISTFISKHRNLFQQWHELTRECCYISCYIIFTDKRKALLAKWLMNKLHIQVAMVWENFYLFNALVTEFLWFSASWKRCDS